MLWSGSLQYNSVNPLQVPEYNAWLISTLVPWTFKMSIICWVLLATKLNQTSSSSVPAHVVPPWVEAVAPAKEPGVVRLQINPPLTTATVAVSQLSFTTGAGVVIQTSKVAVWDKFAPFVYTLILYVLPTIKFVATLILGLLQ